MNTVKRSLVALMFGGSFAVSPLAISLAGTIDAKAGARQLDDDHHFKYPHLHKAMENLRDARKQLDDAEDIFKDHKSEALDHIDKAIKQVGDCLEENHDKDAVLGHASVKLDVDDKYPHIHKALEHLRHAREELDSAEDVFQGQKAEAIEQTDKAIHQLEDIH